MSSNVIPLLNNVLIDLDKSDFANLILTSLGKSTSFISQGFYTSPVLIMWYMATRIILAIAMIASFLQRRLDILLNFFAQ